MINYLCGCNVKKKKTSIKTKPERTKRQIHTINRMQKVTANEINDNENRRNSMNAFRRQNGIFPTIFFFSFVFFFIFFSFSKRNSTTKTEEEKKKKKETTKPLSIILSRNSRARQTVYTVQMVYATSNSY